MPAPGPHPTRWLGLAVAQLLALVIGVSTFAADAPAASATSSGNNSTSRTFTDNSGHSITGQFLTLVDTTVTLQRDDGQKIQVPLGTFSKDDQTYFVTTALGKFTDHGNTLFDFLPVTEKGETTNSTIYGGTLVTWPENYRVTLKNQSLITLANLTIRAVVFKALQLPDAPGTSGSSSIVLIGQTITVKRVSGNSQADFTTTPVTMQEVKIGDGEFPGEPNVRYKTDKLQAIWFRIYDSQGNLLQECCSTPSLMKLQSWATVWSLANPPATPALRGRR